MRDNKTKVRLVDDRMRDQELDTRFYLCPAVRRAQRLALLVRQPVVFNATDALLPERAAPVDDLALVLVRAVRSGVDDSNFLSCDADADAHREQDVGLVLVLLKEYLGLGLLCLFGGGFVVAVVVVRGGVGSSCTDVVVIVVRRRRRQQGVRSGHREGGSRVVRGLRGVITAVGSPRRWSRWLHCDERNATTDRTNRNGRSSPPPSPTTKSDALGGASKTTTHNALKRHVEEPPIS